LSQSEEIFDKFGCQLSVGDWVIYLRHCHNITSTIEYGQINSIIKLAYTRMVFLELIKENGDDGGATINPRHCILFSQEERCMRKMESGL